MFAAPIIARQRSHYFALVALLLAVPILAAALLSKQGFEAPALNDYVSYHCSTGNTRQTKQFRVLTLTARYAIEFADALCASPLMAARYGGVQIDWHARAFLKPQDILDGNFQLFWNRRHVVEGLVPGLYDYYQPIVDSPRYTIYWLSRGPQVRLQQDFFRDKVVGFSQDQQSLTYFLQPMNNLRQAGIELNSQQKRFFGSVSALYEAFDEGEVDIISSARSPLLNPASAPITLTPLREDAPSGSWFLRRDVMNRELACELVTALERLRPLFNRPSAVLVAGGCP